MTISCYVIQNNQFTSIIYKDIIRLCTYWRAINLVKSYNKDRYSRKKTNIFYWIRFITAKREFSTYFNHNCYIRFNKEQSSFVYEYFSYQKLHYHFILKRKELALIKLNYTSEPLKQTQRTANPFFYVWYKMWRRC